MGLCSHSTGPMKPDLNFECMNGFATVQYIRKGLRLVFSNSLRFNACSPMMESILQHLETFAGGLFEETTKLPFLEKKVFIGEFSSPYFHSFFSPSISISQYRTSLSLSQFISQCNHYSIFYFICNVLSCLGVTKLCPIFISYFFISYLIITNSYNL